MSTHLKILSQHDIMIFEAPPEFNSEERKELKDEFQDHHISLFNFDPFGFNLPSAGIKPDIIE